MQAIETVNWLGTTDEDAVTIDRFMKSYHWHRGQRLTREEARAGATEYVRQVTRNDKRASRVIELVINETMLP